MENSETDTAIKNAYESINKLLHLKYDKTQIKLLVGLANKFKEITDKLELKARTELNSTGV